MLKMFNSRCLQRVGQRFRQILQDDTAGNVGKMGFEHCTVVPNVTANVHEYRQVGIPAFRIPLDWIVIHPAASGRLLHIHEFDESFHVVRILGEPRRFVQVSVVCKLKDCVPSIGDILIFVVTQESRHFPKQRVAIFKAI